MEASARLPLRSLRTTTFRLDPAAAMAWLLPAVLIIYLGMNDGGYGLVERSQVGIIVWWIVLAGTVIGALPVAGGTRLGRGLLFLLAAFALWNALSLSWTDSAERTSVEVSRVATYLGVFALALAVQGHGKWRQLLNGVTAGVAIVAGIALLSRLEPTWFPRQIASSYYAPEVHIATRLAYPINYSSGLGALAAMSLPLSLYTCSSARTLLGQALAAAALPAVALTLWLTASGLSVPVAALGVLCFLTLAPDRLPKLLTAVVASAGSAILIAAESQRVALDHGLRTVASEQQGHQLLAIVLVVCTGVALVQVGIGLALRFGRRPEWLSIPRRVAVRASVAAVTVAVIVGILIGLPGWTADRWQSFKQPVTVPSGPRSSQILDTSGDGRYQFWLAAIDANSTHPWLGIGPGTFEYWWAQHGTAPGYVRDAHSLYLETLAELGIIGLALIAIFVVGIVGIGAVRSLRAPPDLRLALAAATSGCLAFAAAAAFDWDWELAVLPVAFLCLGAVATTGGARMRGRHAGFSSLRRRRISEALVVVLAVGGLAVITVPLSSAVEVAQSEQNVGRGQIGAALSDAGSAIAVQPYAATPHIQQALVLEEAGHLRAATQSAITATHEEPTNWSNWLILSRLEAERGNAPAALAAYKRARSLNPRSPAVVPQ